MNEAVLVPLWHDPETGEWREWFPAGEPRDVPHEDVTPEGGDE